MVDLAGDVNSSRRGEKLDAARDIDSAAEEALLFLQKVSEMDADPEQERLAASLALVAGSELFLDGDRGADGLYGAGEGRKETVADVVDDFSRMLFDGLVGDLPIFPEEL
ncbi:MAG TPA: hypothetical protein VGL70_02280 [Candidatus Binatia bacterium]